MTLGTILMEYWPTIAGTASFIFALGFTYAKFREIETKFNAKSDEHSQQREEDYKDFEQQLKAQKKDHDEKITVLQTQQAASEVKIDNLKDSTLDLIKSIQLDIREIMTILKGNTMK